MAKQIQIRRDTAANWTAANPVLAQGEIGIELDGLGTSLVLQKIGDGVTAWDSLPYLSTGGGGATSSDDVSNDSGVSGANVTEALETLQQEIPNPNNLVNQFTTDTQGVSGRFTVQEPLDSNTSDAASVGYVLDKVGEVETPNAAFDTVGGVKISRDTASSTTYISFDGTDTPNVT